jgi:MFS family permease
MQGPYGRERGVVHHEYVRKHQFFVVGEQGCCAARSGRSQPLASCALGLPGPPPPPPPPPRLVARASLSPHVPARRQVLGGFIADFHLGRFGTILLGCATAAVGYLLLYFSVLFGGTHIVPDPHHPTAPGEPARGVNLVLMYGGLVLVALGNGSAVPCISAFVGDQFAPSRSAKRGDDEQLNKEVSSIYRLFYISYNVGAILGMLATPVVVHNASYEIGFFYVLLASVLALPVCAHPACHRRPPRTATGCPAL